MGGFMGEDKKKSPFSNKKLSSDILGRGRTPMSTPNEPLVLDGPPSTYGEPLTQKPFTTEEKFRLTGPPEENQSTDYESLRNVRPDLTPVARPGWSDMRPEHIKKGLYPTRLPELTQTGQYPAPTDDSFTVTEGGLWPAMKRTYQDIKDDLLGQDVPDKIRQDYWKPDITGDVYKYSTNFRDQIAPYYRKVPGGFNRAVSEAQDRLSKRDPLIETLLTGYPTWDPADVDNPIDIYSYATPKQGAVKDTAAGYYMPIEDEYITMGTYPFGPAYAGIQYTHPNSGTIHELPDYQNIQEALPEMMPWHFPKFTFGMPNPYAEDEYPTAHDMVHQYWPRTKATLDHELTHDLLVKPAYQQYGSQSAAQPAYRPHGVTGADYWDYATTPIEMEPRIAEIKRAFASKFGRLPSNLQEAKEAWDWWKEWTAEHNVRGTWTRELIDNVEKNQKLLQEILHRMLEVVAAPTAQPGVNV